MNRLFYVVLSRYLKSQPLSCMHGLVRDVLAHAEGKRPSDADARFVVITFGEDSAGTPQILTRLSGWGSKMTDEATLHRHARTVFKSFVSRFDQGDYEHIR